MQLISEATKYIKQYKDSRTTNWPMMESILPTLAISTIYIFIVKYLCPKFMQNRKPYSLEKVLIAYNILQMVLSSWLFYRFATDGWLTGDYSFRCQPIDHSIEAKTMRMVNTVWWFYISKFTELTETIFFILRKKFEQVNTLHVFHHAIMPLSGHGTFAGFINSFVHIVMYFYYLLSALGPQVRKRLWWKKYLTSFQMVQFAMILVHSMQLVFIECNFPRLFAWYMGGLGLAFFTLFCNFYKNAYKFSKSE